MSNNKNFDDLNRTDLPEDRAWEICADILARLRARKGCIDARKSLVDTCFPGSLANDEHIDHIEVHRRALAGEWLKYFKKCGDPGIENDHLRMDVLPWRGRRHCKPVTGTALPTPGLEVDR